MSEKEALDRAWKLYKSHVSNAGAECSEKRCEAISATQGAGQALEGQQVRGRIMQQLA